MEFRIFREIVKFDCQSQTTVFNHRLEAKRHHGEEKIQPKKEKSA